MLAGRLVAVAALALAAIWSPFAAADEVLLHNGFSLKGRVDERGDQLVVHTPNGRVWVPKSQVNRIDRRDTPGQVFERRRTALLDERPEDLDARVALAKWALARNLRTAGRRELQDVIAVDPDHAAARAALGFVRHASAWVTPDEQKRLAGLVRDDGEWITAEEANLRRAQRLDGLAAIQAAADAERTAALTRKIEAETRLAEAQADAAEREAERSRRWYAEVVLHAGGYARTSVRRPTPTDHRPGDPCRAGPRLVRALDDPHTRLRNAHRDPDDPHTRLRAAAGGDARRAAPLFSVTFGTLAFRPFR